MNSKSAGVLIDSWKLAIFRKGLDAADFIYTENGDPQGKMLTLLVAYEQKEFLKLQEVIKFCNAEAAAFKASKKT